MKPDGSQGNELRETCKTQSVEANDLVKFKYVNLANGKLMVLRLVTNFSLEIGVRKVRRGKNSPLGTKMTCWEQKKGGPCPRQGMCAKHAQQV